MTKTRRSRGDGNTRRQGSGPRGARSVPPASAGGTSALHEPVWAVIGDHYVEFDLTYDEAREQVRELKGRKQPGLVIVTNEAAKRMTMAAAGVTASSLPDMKF